MWLDGFRKFLSRNGKTSAGAGAAGKGRRRRRVFPTVEVLENRTVPTTTLFLDFGDRLVNNNWLVTTEASLTAAGVNGPNFDNVAGTDNLTFYSFAEAVGDANNGNGFDYNEDGVLNTADVTELRANVITLVQRYYSPFNIEVIDLAGSQGASNLDEVAAKLASNNDFDAYVFVTGVVANPGTISASLRGVSGHEDGLYENQNTMDNTAVVLANHVFNRGYADATAATSLAYIIAHEAAHTFGMLHTENHPTASDGVKMLTQSDIISKYPDQFFSTGADHGKNLHMFSRFPLPTAANEQSELFPIPEMENPHDILVVNGVRGPAYITGTGAHDLITVTRLDASIASVSVEAHRDNSYADRIGDTFSYQVNYVDGLLIDAGFLDDRIIIDATLGVDVTVRGMGGTDELIVNGNWVASGTYAPNANTNLTAAEGLDGNESYGGTLTFGATRIIFSEFEPASKVRVHSVNSLTFESPEGADDLQIDSPEAGLNRIAGTIAGGSADGPVEFVPLLFSSVPSVTVDVGSKDSNPTGDIISLDSPGLVATELTNLTINTGNGDDLFTAAFSPSLPVSGGVVSLVYDGGEGIDTIKGDNLSSTWKITAKNQGTLNDATSFVNVENLTGTTWQDVFKFEVGGGVDGNIDGGQAFDTLDLSPLNLPTNRVNVSGAGSIDGTTGNFLGPAIGGIFDNIDLIKFGPGVTITPTDGGTTVFEGGVADTYTVVLDAVPTLDVTITLLPDSALTASQSVLIFTPDNWDQPQTVTVSAPADALIQGNRTVLIEHVAASDDSRYNAITITPVGVSVLETSRLHPVTDREPNQDPRQNLERVAGTDGWVITGSLTHYWAFGQMLEDSDVYLVPVEPGHFIDFSHSTPWGLDRGGLGYGGGPYPFNSTFPSSWAGEAEVSFGGSIETSYTLSVWLYRDINVNNWEYRPSFNGSAMSVRFDYDTYGYRGPFEAGLYQSADTVFDASDTLLAIETFQGNPPPVNEQLLWGDNWGENRGRGVFNLSAPMALDPTRPYLLVVADPNDAIYERDFIHLGAGRTNNEAWFELDMGAEIQISQAAFDGSRSSVRFDYAASVTIEGDTAPMGRPFEAGLYLSATPVLDKSKATLFAKLEFDGNGNSGVFNLSQPIPDDGSRPHLFVVADPDNDITEANEGNNQASFYHATPKVKIIETNGGTAVAEGGAMDTYKVVLTAKPKTNAVIAIISNKQLKTSVTSLTFTPENWNKPQTVTVTAVDDKVAEGDHAAAIKHFWMQAPPGFKSFVIPRVAVTIRDNDRAGVKIIQTAGSTKVKEGGFVDSYTIRLTSQPTHNVTIWLTPNPQLSLPRFVTFTPKNWNTAQTVTVRAKDDKVAEGKHTAAIKHTISSADPNYSPLNLTIADVIVTIFDNDVLA